MNNRALEPYDKHYHRGTMYCDSRGLALKELARDRAPRWLCRRIHAARPWVSEPSGRTAVGLIVCSAFYHSLTHYPMNRFIEMRRRISKRLLETTMGRAPRCNE